MSWKQATQRAHAPAQREENPSLLTSRLFLFCFAAAAVVLGLFLKK
jgi:hypothetical protein